MLSAARANEPAGELLLPQARERAGFPALAARLAEVEAVLADDREGFAAAADLYSALDLPYDEARCRLASDQRQAAVELIGRHGFDASLLSAPRAEDARSR